MGGVGEHVNGLDFCYFVCLIVFIVFIGFIVFFGLGFVVEEVVKVSGEGFGVAGDVDYLFGGEGGDGVEEGLCAAGTGRVEDDYIYCFIVVVFLAFFVAFCQGFDEVSGVSVVEFYVLYVVLLCILDGILYGILFEFHAYDFLCAFGGGEDAYGACAAVGVKNGLALEVSLFEGLGVELFGLRVVNLVKGAGGDLEGAAEESVLDEAFAEEDFLSGTQDEVCVVWVYVVDDCGDFGVLL